MDKIVIKGARENNLKNINIELPKNKFIVMTGVSGSGKSSLAFDTLCAEGERRYLESLNSYARQFLGNSQKPDVDSIEGLSPTISIDQKTTNNNPRSTVGTVTEIYDYLRLLFSKIGVPICPKHNIPIKNQSIEEMTNKVLLLDLNSKIVVLSPIVEGKKGSFTDLLENFRKQGYVRAYIDDVMYDLSDDVILDKNKKHNISIVIDRLVITPDIRSRLYESLEQACKLSDGKVIIDVIGKEKLIFSENFACPYCDFSLSELEPRIFSFNAPYGACPDCKGLGFKKIIDPDLIMPDKTKSIYDGGIVTMGDDSDGIYFKRLESACKHFNIDLSKPINKLSKKELDIILYGSTELIKFNYSAKSGTIYNNTGLFEGVINNLERRYIETNSDWIREWIDKYMIELPCPTCKGARLKEEVLSVKINGKNIDELTRLNITEIYNFLSDLKLNEEQEQISKLLIKEIKDRLSFLINVGLDYLTLNREASTLSGGESQRIRLATQIGTRLTGVLYVLDEPRYYIVDREFSDGETLPIGRACDNCDVFAVKEDGTAADVGEEGELYARGSFLAMGYYNNPEKTAAAFVQNPLNTAYPETVYKTGDLVKRNENGELIYISRKDFQIKHMGYRIELGEIEAAAYASEGLSSAAVIYDKAEDRIILIYTGRQKDVAEIMNALKSRLPDYMLPQKIIRVKTMPINANGKTDRKWLTANYKNI